MDHDESLLDELAMLVQGAAAVIALLWGLLPSLVQLLVILQTCDIVSGITVAAKRGSVASRRMRLMPKVMVLMLVALAYYIDRKMQMTIASAVCGWYCMKEGLSIVENAGRLGVPVPAKLRRVFEAMKVHDGEHSA